MIKCRQGYGRRCVSADTPEEAPGLPLGSGGPAPLGAAAAGHSGAPSRAEGVTPSAPQMRLPGCQTSQSLRKTVWQCLEATTSCWPSSLGDMGPGALASSSRPAGRSRCHCEALAGVQWRFSAQIAVPVCQQTLQQRHEWLSVSIKHLIEQNPKEQSSEDPEVKVQNAASSGSLHRRTMNRLD